MNELAKNFFVETNYTGVNVGAISTPKGIVAIDAPSFPRDARDWAMRLHRLNQFPVQFLILTDYHGDRTINARWFNAPTIAHEETAVRLNNYDKRYPPQLSESLSLRYPQRSREFGNNPVERPVYSFNDKMTLFKGNYEVRLIAAAGPSAGNVMVYVPETAVLFTGDILVNDTHPWLGDGRCLSWLNTLDTIARWPEKLEVIIPGRGPIHSPQSLQPTRDYLRRLVDCAQTVRQNHQPREDTTRFIPELLSQFPLGDLPVDWIKKQIKLSLERAYDEIKSLEANEQ